jgi:hypothetical protein
MSGPVLSNARAFTSAGVTYAGRSLMGALAAQRTHPSFGLLVLGPLPQRFVGPRIKSNHAIMQHSFYPTSRAASPPKRYPYCHRRNFIGYSIATTQERRHSDTAPPASRAPPLGRLKRAGVRSSFRGSLWYLSSGNQLRKKVNQKALRGPGR